MVSKTRTLQWDVCKKFLINYRSPNYIILFYLKDAFVKIARNEGIASFWSGLSPTLVLAVPATIVYFVTYEQLRLKLKDDFNKNRPNEYHQPYWIPLVSGATARLFSTTLVSPLELMRTKMQSRKLSFIGEYLPQAFGTFRLTLNNSINIFFYF